MKATRVCMFFFLLVKKTLLKKHLSKVKILFYQKVCCALFYINSYNIDTVLFLVLVTELSLEISNSTLLGQQYESEENRFRLKNVTPFFFILGIFLFCR